MECPVCQSKKEASKNFDGDACSLLMAAYILAGLAMMLNIRLSYSSAPYALIRFKLHENLFSVFVRRMASALELWCLPSMALGNLIEIGLKVYYKIEGYKTVNYNEGNWDSHLGNLVTRDTDDSGNSAISDDKLKPARELKNKVIIVPSIVSQWLNFLTYLILLVVFLTRIYKCLIRFCYQLDFKVPKVNEKKF
uniref:Uncharacterized protein n=1 Tax=Theileria annulata TaxID=5874 RepID=A0A3B0MMT8_THEAN